MKTNILAFLMISLIFTFCSSDNTQKNNNSNKLSSRFKEYKTIPSNWYELGPFISYDDNEKIICFSGKGESMARRMAFEKAKLDSLGKAASAIKKITRKQLLIIEKYSEKGELTGKIIKKIIKTTSNNVELSGMRIVKRKTSMSSKNGRRIITVYLLSALPYYNYKKAREKAIKELKEKNIATDVQVTKIIKQFNKLEK